MSPQAQRLAIAKMCPKLVEWHDDIPFWRGGWSAAGEGNEHFAEFDPLNDLNAMREAEETLLNLPEYCYALCAVAYGVDWAAEANKLHQGWWVIHATAAQRAEAFLRTLNLWGDSL